jgi:hypothetical protein
MFISFSLCCNNFTSLAYEIFYAKKVDLFDKIKEVVFSQLFPCVRVNPRKTKTVAVMIMKKCPELWARGLGFRESGLE